MAELTHISGIRIVTQKSDKATGKMEGKGTKRVVKDELYEDDFNDDLDQAAAAHQISWKMTLWLSE